VESSTEGMMTYSWKGDTSNHLRNETSASDGMSNWASCRWAIRIYELKGYVILMVARNVQSIVYRVYVYSCLDHHRGEHKPLQTRIVIFHYWDHDSRRQVSSMTPFVREIVTRIEARVKGSVFSLQYRLMALRDNKWVPQFVLPQKC
jgi:hypothetical protein